MAPFTALMRLQGFERRTAAGREALAFPQPQLRDFGARYLDASRKNHAQDDGSVASGNTRVLRKVDPLAVSSPLSPMGRLVVRVEVALQDGVDAGAVGAVEHQDVVGGVAVALEELLGRRKRGFGLLIADVVDPFDAAADVVVGNQRQRRQQSSSLVESVELSSDISETEGLVNRL